MKVSQKMLHRIKNTGYGFKNLMDSNKLRTDSQSSLGRRNNTGRNED